MECAWQWNTWDFLTVSGIEVNCLWEFISFEVWMWEIKHRRTWGQFEKRSGRDSDMGGREAEKFREVERWQDWKLLPYEVTNVLPLALHEPRHRGLRSRTDGDLALRHCKRFAINKKLVISLFLDFLLRVIQLVPAPSIPRRFWPSLQKDVESKVTFCSSYSWGCLSNNSFVEWRNELSRRSFIQRSACL